MNNSTNSLEMLMNKYGDTLYRIAIVITANEQDAEDAVQETFIRFLSRNSGFRDDGHEKAWFITVTTNICRDMRRFKARHKTYDLDSCMETAAGEESKEILEELIMLPPKYKIPVYLHYIEGYSVKEISSMLHCTQNAVKKRLQRGREVLKIRYEKLD